MARASINIFFINTSISEFFFLSYQYPINNQKASQCWLFHIVTLVHWVFHRILIIIKKLWTWQNFSQLYSGISEYFIFNSAEIVKVKKKKKIEENIVGMWLLCYLKPFNSSDWAYQYLTQKCALVSRDSESEHVCALCAQKKLTVCTTSAISLLPSVSVNRDCGNFLPRPQIPLLCKYFYYKRRTTIFSLVCIVIFIFHRKLSFSFERSHYYHNQFTYSWFIK